MAYIIAVANQKGGVGKTTTAVNLASYLASKGRFVLLVDLDPQGNASSGLGVNIKEVEKGVYETLIDDVPMREAVRRTVVDGLSIVPATPGLAGAAIEMVDFERREYRLSDSLLEVRNNYDYVIIDCPPSLDLLTINGLVSADRVLIPVQAEYYALEGLSQLLQTIEAVRSGLRPTLEVFGAVLTMHDPRNRLSGDVMTELNNHFPNRIFKSVIPRNVRLAEAPSYGQPIQHYDPWSKGAKAYESLAIEILEIDQEL
jgi:chromosome partitioning protein